MEYKRIEDGSSDPGRLRRWRSHAGWEMLLTGTRTVISIRHATSHARASRYEAQNQIPLRLRKLLPALASMLIVRSAANVRHI